MKEQIKGMVMNGIETGDYSYIREAEKMAYENGIEMTFDDEWVSVEDEVFYFNGAF